MAEFTEQEKVVIKAIQEQLPPEQFEKFMQQSEEQIKNQIAQIIEQQKSPKNGQECIFCKIAGGEVSPTYKVFENDKVLAFLDIFPANMGHIIVIPKQHYVVLPQMPDDAVASLFKVVKKMSAVVFEATGAQGVAIRQRNGKVAAQLVPHVHVHVIPRFESDGIEADWKQNKPKPEELEAMKNKIISKIPIETAESVPKEPQEKIYIPMKIPK